MRGFWLYAGVVVASISSISAARAEDSTFVCRPEVYSRLVKAQKLLDASKYQEAEKAAKLVMRRRGLNDHEKALVMQTLGYIYAGQERLPLAAETLEKTHQLHALPAATQTSMLFNIGQIHLANEHFSRAAEVFDEWLKSAKNPTARSLYTVAAANFQAHKYAATIKHGERALGATKRPSDGLLQLLLATYVKLKRYPPAIRVQKRLTERHPDKRNSWLRLAELYSQTRDEKRALAVLQLGRAAGVLDTSDDLRRVSQRLLAQGIPQQAGILLEGPIKAGQLNLTADVAKLVATAWLQARDVDKAAPALRKAAELARDAELYVRLAQLELDRERYRQAVSAGEAALELGGLDRPGRVELLIGIAHLRSGRRNSALAAFRRASKDTSTRSSAEAWIRTADTAPGLSPAAN